MVALMWSSPSRGRTHRGGHSRPQARLHPFNPEGTLPRTAPKDCGCKRDITIYCLYETGAFFNTVDEEDEDEFWDAPFETQIDTICKLNGFTREDIDIDDVITCYYLTQQELPGDFNGRGGCLNDEQENPE